MSGFGTWLESDWYETRNELPCKCGAVFPRHAADHLSSVSINGIFTDCTKCKPNGERSRRIKEIANRIKATLFRHRHAKPRIVCNDVAVRLSSTVRRFNFRSPNRRGRLRCVSQE